MGLSVIPTNIGGVNIPLAQLQGPLAKLFQNQDPSNLLYPADLASNPVMGHAVQFSVHDYTTGFGNMAQDVISVVANAAKGVAAGDAAGIITQGTSALITATTTTAGAVNAAGKVLPSLAKLAIAQTYRPVTKTEALATISLFMPDTLAVTYNSNYTDVHLTDILGLKGYAGNAYQEMAQKNPTTGEDFINAIPGNYAKGIAAAALDKINSGLLGKAGLGDIALNGMGLATNPQTQLLYKGISLRQFTLEFIMTPKSTQEAETVRNICDTFAYFSAPGLAGNSGGAPGQYLTPPQIFKIKFKFLGGNGGLIDSVTNVFKSALSNIGLGFLTTPNPTDTITNGAQAKIMVVNDCFLENVNVDYAPNGWAAYNDGYPIQTRLTLTFKENQIITKEDIAKMNPGVGNSAVGNQIAQANGYKNLAAMDAANPGLNEG